MNEIRNKIQEITSPLAKNQGTSIRQGEVLESNEKENTCTVSYTKEDGAKCKKYNVPIALVNISIADWFPEKGDYVLVQDKDGTAFITGPAYSNYASVRNSLKPKNDFLADTFGSFFGGLVF